MSGSAIPDRFHELTEQRPSVVRPWSRFWVILHGKNRQLPVPNSLDGVVIEVNVRHLEPGRSRDTLFPALDGKSVHLDLRPYPGDDLQAEAARLRTLGATAIDLGQSDVPWTVLADPEGNEFCLLAPG